MGRVIFRRVTTSYDTIYGAFTGTALAQQDTLITLVTLDGPQTFTLTKGRALAMTNVPVQRISVNGEILLVGVDHRLREYIPSSVELKGEIVEIGSAPSLESRLDTIDSDIQSINSLLTSQLDVVLSTRASEDTLTQVNNKLSQPTSLQSQLVTIDNSGGTADLIQALFSTSTPSKQATLYRDPADSGVVYIGDSTTQAFPFNPGDTINTLISDLSLIYVKVPAGGVANIYVLWEV